MEPFYEDDEPVPDVTAAFDAGARGVTGTTRIMLTPAQAIERFGAVQAGPCAGCGAEGYGLSMGGPSICVNSGRTR